MLKQHQMIKLKILENKAANRLGKLPRQLLNETGNKEKILAEIRYQRNIMDACQLCLSH